MRTPVQEVRQLPRRSDVTIDAHDRSSKEEEVTQTVNTDHDKSRQFVQEDCGSASQAN